jgi:hypothetical protein
VPEYVITPQEAPSWRIDPDDFLERIRARWPQARTGRTAEPDDPASTEALIPFGPSQRELGVALSNQGYSVYLDPADPDTAAEFAAWYIGQVPATEPPIFLFAMDFDANVPLSPERAADDIRAALAQLG